MSNLTEKLTAKLKPTHRDALRDCSLIILVATMLVLIWFRKGLMMATGEAGLFPFYETERQFNSARYVWWNVDTGWIFSHIIVSLPFLFFITLFEQLGVSAMVMQGATFAFILILGGVSVYYLTSYIVKDGKKHMAGIVAALFYMLNPFMIVSIWNRFLISLIFLTALLPLMLILYIKGLEEHKIYYTVYMCVVSMVFGLALSHPSNLISLWLPLVSYFIFYIFENRNKKPEVIYAFKFSSILVILWLLLNAWWLIQFITTAPYLFGERATTAENLGLLLSASEQSGGLFYIARLINYPFFKDVWPIYLSLTFSAIGLLILVIIFFSLFKWKNKFIRYFFFLSLFGLFLAKGAAPPLGEIFVWIFTNFQVFQVFRDPFGKLGVIPTLGYAPLFGVGLSLLYCWVRKRAGLLSNNKHAIARRIMTVGLVGLICFLIFGLYAWPMWTGNVYWETNYVDVPSYYPEANSWLSGQREEFRVIALPIDGEGITYNWTHGYGGLEPSFQLFDKPFVSKTTWVPYVDNIVVRLQNVLFRTSEFWKVMGVLNAKYILLRHDVDYSARGMLSPNNVEKAFTLKPSLIDGKVTTSSLGVGQLLNETKQNWALIWHIEGTTITVTQNDTMQATSSIVWSGIPCPMPEGGRILFLLYNLPRDKQDWRNSSYLLVWLKSSVSGIVRIEVSDNEGNSMVWSGQNEPLYSILPKEVGTWKLFIFPIDLPSFTYKGRTNLQAIRQIGFRVSTGNENAKLEKLKIGGIFIDCGSQREIKYINYTKSFGELDFYKLSDEYFLSRIYATNKFILGEDVDDMLFNIIPSDGFDPRETIVFLNSQSSINNIIKLKNLSTDLVYKPGISFEKIDPTKYVVHVKNSTHPFFLVLSETYSPQWKAYVNSETLSDEYHFIANGYANAWYIDKTGSFDIVLEFSPQKLVYYGVVVSLVTSVSCLVYFSRKPLRTAYHCIIKRMLKR